MDTTRTYDDSDTMSNGHATLAAAFPDKESARDAVRRLNDEGFGETWLGVTRSDESGASSAAAGDTRVEADNWFMRFFGEGDESLHDALIRRGVSAADARTAGDLSGHGAIVTVAGANHPELAAQIISEGGGHLITKGFGAMGYGTTGTYAAASGSSATASRGTFPSGRGAAVGSSLAGDAPYDVAMDSAPTAGASLGTVGSATDDRLATDVPLTADAYGVTAPQNYGMYRGGKTIDEDTRIQLREERLRIDKEKRSAGEATISKEIVSQKQEVDVPLIHEELFIERRPVSGTAAVAGGVIGEGSEVVHIPLTEEKLNVSKIAYVTEEVVVGKREVETTGHVSETTRKEELNVNNVDTSVRGTTTASPFGTTGTSGLTGAKTDPLI